MSDAPNKYEVFSDEWKNEALVYSDGVGEVLVAKGGWCAPMTPMYDLHRPIWEYADSPRWPNWDDVVAPRLTRSIALVHEARRRARAAWRALTTPLAPRPHDDEDDW